MEFLPFARFWPVPGDYDSTQVCLPFDAIGSDIGACLGSVHLGFLRRKAHVVREVGPASVWTCRLATQRSGAIGPQPVGRKDEHRRIRGDFGAQSRPESLRLPEALCGRRRVVWLSPWGARGRGWGWVAGLRCGLTGLRRSGLGSRRVFGAAGPAWGPLPFDPFHDKSSI